MQKIKGLIRKSERGQAIIIIAFAMIGLVAIVGLVSDTGILLIEYGRLKRSVDAAAIAAAQEYSKPTAELTTASFTNAATNFLNFNQTGGVTSIDVHSCLSTDPQPPVLCNDDPITHPERNRKLVEVTASMQVNFSFLSVIGIRSTTITTNAIGEAATLDLVLVLDTSGSMAYETKVGGRVGNDPDVNPYPGDVDSENPKVCNTSLTHPCSPMDGVKKAALDFINNTMNFDYDRAAIVTLTGQATDGSAKRYPMIVKHLSSNYIDIRNTIFGLNVFTPHDCDPSLTTAADFNPDPGVCINYVDNTFTGVICQSFEALADGGIYNFAPCPSSNIGGALRLASSALSDPQGTTRRLDSYWVVILLMSGPANATDTYENYPSPTYSDGVPSSFPYGYCPPSTYYPSGGMPGQFYDYKFCTDGQASVRHAYNSTINFTYNGVTEYGISNYDPDDYARDWADKTATLLNGDGVTIYTIGIGKEILKKGAGYSDPSDAPMAQSLLKYIAECAGEGVYVCPNPMSNPKINHGQYFEAPKYSDLLDIFHAIGENIATKISQ